jgi:hypothetical protein
VVLIFGARSHRRWLAHQTPAGVWQGMHPERGAVLIAFDGGPHEGVYRELITLGDCQSREMGHWATNGNELRLLIMATDVSNHPRFGVDTVYQIRYTGPQRICVDGPDRPSLVLDKAAADTRVPIEPFEP